MYGNNSAGPQSQYNTCIVKKTEGEKHLLFNGPCSNATQAVVRPPLTSFSPSELNLRDNY